MALLGSQWLHTLRCPDDVHAFALKPWLMKPYYKRGLARQDRIAYYKISRGRRVVNNSLSILASSFRTFKDPMQQPPRTVKKMAQHAQMVVLVLLGL